MQNVGPDHNYVYRECSNVQKHVEGSEPIYEIYLTLEI